MRIEGVPTEFLPACDEDTMPASVRHEMTFESLRLA
jgi:hypothetical protein